MAFNNLVQHGEQSASLAAFRVMVQQNQESIFDKTVGGAYAGLESARLNSGNSKNIEDKFADLTHEFRSNLFGEDDTIDEIGLESAVRAALLLGDANQYRDRFINGIKNGGGVGGERVVHMTLSGGYGDIPLQDAAGLERFNNASFDKFKDETLYLNYHAAKANAFSELYFPTVQVGADLNGLTLSLRRDVVQGKWCNPMTGEMFDLGKTHLIEALRYSDMLSSSHNKLVPQVRTVEDEQYFIDKNIYAPHEIELDGKKFITAPLKPSENEFNLLGISRAPGEMSSGNAYTSDDMVDPNLRLKTIYLNINDKLVPVNVLQMLHSVFTRGAKIGSDSRMSLMFKHDQVTLSTDAVDVAQAEVPELKALKDAGIAIVTFKTFITGTFHHETSNIIVKPAGIVFTGAYRPDQRDVNQANDPLIKPLLDALTATFDGYDLDGTLSNKNIRIQGTLLDNERIEYTVPMLYGSPVSARRPIDKEDTTDEVRTLVAGRTIRTDNNAVKFLLNGLDRLHEFCKSGAKLASPFDLGSPGAFYVQPWVEYYECDLKDLIGSEKSSERADDINAGLIDLLADAATRMITESVYLPTKRSYYNNPNAKVKWGLGTTPQIARHLIMWDNRKLGGQDADMDPVPVVRTTEDIKMEDTIILVPISENENSGYDAFAFGARFAQPSIVTEVNITQGGETFKLLQTIPVETFLINMPLAYKLTVRGLSEYMAMRPVADRKLVNANEIQGGGGGTGPVGTVDVNIVSQAAPLNVGDVALKAGSTVALAAGTTVGIAGDVSIADGATVKIGDQPIQTTTTP